MGRPGGAHERLDGVMAAPGEGAGRWGWNAAAEDFDGEGGSKDAGGLCVCVNVLVWARWWLGSVFQIEQGKRETPPSDIVDEDVADRLGKLALVQEGHLFVVWCV